MHRGGVVGESFDFGLVEFVFGERVGCCALDFGGVSLRNAEKGGREYLCGEAYEHR